MIVDETIFHGIHFSKKMCAIQFRDLTIVGVEIYLLNQLTHYGVVTFIINHGVHYVLVEHIIILVNDV